MFNPLEHPVCLQEPQRLTDIDSWHEHIPFAFVLVDLLRPKVFVELGVYKGDSYCAFCQAVDATGLDAACYGVDTWEGDAQSGYYHEGVFNELSAYHDARYRRFSTLLKSTFDEASGHFADGSVDLLHMDGLHTCEATEHDFETWLPKMSRRGVVLFHDTNERQGDFGVWRLWNELKGRYRGFEFKHGHGLGVLPVGADVPPILEVFRDGDDSSDVVSRFFFRLGSQLAVAHGRGLQIKALEADRTAMVEQLRGQTDRIEFALQQIADLQAECVRVADQSGVYRRQLQELRGDRTRMLEQLRTQGALLETTMRDLDLLRDEPTVRVWRAAGATARQAAAQISRALQRYRRIHGTLDLPAEGTSVSSAVQIGGWAHSTAAPVNRVEVLVGGRVVAPLRYGVERPDALRLRRPRRDAHCGFTGIVDLRAVPPGWETLVVRVTDERGNRHDFRRRVFIERPRAEEKTVAQAVDGAASPTQREPAGEIEVAAWCGHRLELAGWCWWPESSSPRLARIYANETFVGETPVALSRPDIAAHVGNPSACRSGFRFRHSVLPPPDALGQSVLIVIRFTEAGGRELRRSLRIRHEISSFGHAGAGFLERLEALTVEFQARFGHDPVILDWSTGFDLAAAFPHHTVFSAPTRAATLPYLDHTVDLVVTATRELARLQEAQRVAEGAVVNALPVAPAALPDGQESAVEVLWLREPVEEFSLGVSIIIPVHNNVAYTEACLTALVATLPRTVQQEVIVVDDGSTDGTDVALQHWVRRDPRIQVLRNGENAGFVDSCNRGADAATGEILVFLNNDTIPQTDWLPPLLQIFRDRPDAGAVGGRLIYPDGRLQEAGGVIFSDGSGANFGKHAEEADAPLYNYVREVDYCSGALLATRRDLFRAIGGFDTRYRPAYFEDADYCFTVREKGYKVYYQPESTIVHVEGGTAGTDESSGAKRYQAVNRSTFVRKWQHVLERQPKPPSQYDAVTLHALAVREVQDGQDS